MKNYKRLGDYIREVNVRNRELEVTDPMGININKHFPSFVTRLISSKTTTDTELTYIKLCGKEIIIIPQSSCYK